MTQLSIPVLVSLFFEKVESGSEHEVVPHQKNIRNLQRSIFHIIHVSYGKFIIDSEYDLIFMISLTLNELFAFLLTWVSFQNTRKKNFHPFSPTFSHSFSILHTINKSIHYFPCQSQILLTSHFLFHKQTF